MTIRSLESTDVRQHDILVAGPAALVVSKAYKIMDRLTVPKRAHGVAKDALDIVRVLRGCPSDDVEHRMREILDGRSSRDEVRRATAAIAAEAVEFMRMEFAVPAGRGCRLALEAAVGAMEQEEFLASTVELTRRLLRGL
jgi:hypothetical protein